MNNRQIIITNDGSHSIAVPHLDEHYHSIHGAVQESKHVYIENGLKACKKSSLVVFEVGFGTGLNAFLSLLEAEKEDIHIDYYCIEKYPLTIEEYSVLNYAENSKREQEYFSNLHSSAWGSLVEITSNFSIFKIEADLTRFNFEHLPYFDVIFFDAFAPNKQEKMWSKSIFENISCHSNTESIFVTYCAKGTIRRQLAECGFLMERLKGPPGKMEMLRGVKK